MNTFPEESSLHTEAAGTSPPDAFGPFRVLHQIGAGALGPVFRAYEPERDRLVAVKLFRLDLPPERIHHLVAEFEQLIAADLGHPAIAAPRATGIDGVCAYLAQDYVTADSLDIVIRESGAALPAEVLRVATHLADALDFAAVRQVVHGALHPRDVLLSKEEVRLTGLGVTRALERAGGAAPMRRPYTAPERIGGGAWDRRADVFSLAAVVHELLCGRRLSGSGAQAAESLTETPGGDLKTLRQVFARALADDMADRFATATEFAQALAGAFDLDVRAVGSRPPVGRASSRVAPRSAAVSPPIAAPRLPLDGDGQAEPDLALHPAGPGDEFQLRDPVDRRYQQAEAAAEIEPASVLDPESEPGEPLPPEGFLSPRAPVESSSLSLMWPLALAGIIGAALGFGAGYAVAIRERPPAAAVVATAPASTAPLPPAGRDFTEGKVNEAPPPAPTPTAPPAPPVAPPAPTAVPSLSGRVLVRSTPVGAHVFVDGQARGDTPATVRELSPGPHRIRVVRDGYTTVDRRIVVSTSRPAHSLVVAMSRISKPVPITPVAKSSPGPRGAPVEGVNKPAGAPTAPGDPGGPGSPGSPGSNDGGLVVESRPAGAKVFVDGREVGTTPLSLTGVAAGEHAVRLERDGYQPWSSSVRVIGSEQNRVTASLER